MSDPSTTLPLGPGFVTLTETGPLHRVDCTYDTKTSMLSAMALMQEVGLAKITHRIRLTGQR